MAHHPRRNLWTQHKPVFQVSQILGPSLLLRTSPTLIFIWDQSCVRIWVGTLWIGFGAPIISAFGLLYALFCCCSSLETHWQPWQPAWMPISTSVYAPTHSWVVQAVTQPLAVRQALCKHCAGDIILFKSHNSPQRVLSAIFRRGIWDSVLAIVFHDVEILDSVVFLQRGLIDSAAGSNLLKSQAAFGKWQLKSKFNSFFFPLAGWFHTCVVQGSARDLRRVDT